jgi:hypothetical protein
MEIVAALRAHVLAAESHVDHYTTTMSLLEKAQGIAANDGGTGGGYQLAIDASRNIPDADSTADAAQPQQNAHAFSLVPGSNFLHVLGQDASRTRVWRQVSVPKGLPFRRCLLHGPWCPLSNPVTIAGPGRGRELCGRETRRLCTATSACRR